jgi:hypothetical protein
MVTLSSSSGGWGTTVRPHVGLGRVPGHGHRVQGLDQGLHPALLLLRGQFLVFPRLHHGRRGHGRKPGEEFVPADEGPGQVFPGDFQLAHLAAQDLEDQVVLAVQPRGEEFHRRGQLAHGGHELGGELGLLEGPHVRPGKGAAEDVHPPGQFALDLGVEQGHAREQAFEQGRALPGCVLPAVPDRLGQPDARPGPVVHAHLDDPGLVLGHAVVPQTLGDPLHEGVVGLLEPGSGRGVLLVEDAVAQPGGLVYLLRGKRIGIEFRNQVLGQEMDLLLVQDAVLACLAHGGHDFLFQRRGRVGHVGC